MNLVEASWIPVRDHGGSGVFRLLTYEELLCSNGEWQVNLPRDDLELACIQLLVCMTQVMFLPESGGQLRDWHAGPLAPEVFTDGAALCREWFDLDHPTQPFMQSRGVKAAETTPVQKLLIGLPEGNNHAFFNEVGEVKRIGAAAAAIALFNQASNCPSFGGGFKAGLRGGSPVTTLVAGRHLRETLWRNVLPRERINTFLPLWQRGDPDDVPTWVRPIQEGETIQAQSIGLVRGLFWQPAKVELVADEDGECDLLGTKGPRYRGFRKEKFNFSIAGLWPHPHGARVYSDKKDWKFASFTTAAPAWNWLAELVVPRRIDGADMREGCVPAPAIAQLREIAPKEMGCLHLLVGGYRTNQASVTERQHELFSLAAGWDKSDADNLKILVDLAKQSKGALRGRLFFASKGNKDKGMKSIGAPIYEAGEKLFYARTEALIRDTVANASTWDEFLAAKESFVGRLSMVCEKIFSELTDPYAVKPELIPIIAWARRSMNSDLLKLREGK